MATNEVQTFKPLTIRRRLCLSTAWTVFGLVFFYLLMVALSSLASGIVLDRLPRHGWARSASRHTGAMTVPAFALFLITSPASLWSLFLAVMVACSHFCHFVIIASDVRVYSDKQVMLRMFRTERSHPIFRLLPLKTAHVVGTIGLVAMLVVSTERCYGPWLGKREARLPFITRACCAWIWAVFNIFFTERLIFALTLNKDLEEVLYPVAFLLILALSAWKCANRESRWDKAHRVDMQKKAE